MNTPPKEQLTRTNPANTASIPGRRRVASMSAGCCEACEGRSGMRRAMNAPATPTANAMSPSTSDRPFASRKTPAEGMNTPGALSANP